MNTDNYGFDATIYDWDELKTVNNEITCLDCGEEIGSCECGSDQVELALEQAIFDGVAVYNARYAGVA
jgi:hypothetical protein